MRFKERQVTQEPDPYIKMLRAQIKRAKQLDPELMRCRRGLLGHAWEFRRPDWESKTPGVVPVARQCLRCGAIARYDISAKYGEQLSAPRYQYPDGYLDQRGKDQPPLSAQSLRAAFAERLKSDLPDLKDVEQST